MSDARLARLIGYAGGSRDLRHGDKTEDELLQRVWNLASDVNTLATDLAACEAREATLKEALRVLADYGPLEGTKRWNAMDSGHRGALLRARALLDSLSGEGPNGQCLVCKVCGAVDTNTPADSECPNCGSIEADEFAPDDPVWEGPKP